MSDPFKIFSSLEVAVNIELVLLENRLAFLMESYNDGIGKDEALKVFKFIKGHPSLSIIRDPRSVGDGVERSRYFVFLTKNKKLIKYETDLEVAKTLGFHCFGFPYKTEKTKITVNYTVLLETGETVIYKTEVCGNSDINRKQILSEVRRDNETIGKLKKWKFSVSFERFYQYIMDNPFTWLKRFRNKPNVIYSRWFDTLKPYILNNYLQGQNIPIQKAPYSKEKFEEWWARNKLYVLVVMEVIQEFDAIINIDNEDAVNSAIQRCEKQFRFLIN